MGLSQNGIQLLWHVANWENDSLNHWDFGVDMGFQNFETTPCIHIPSYTILWPTARP